MRKLVPNRVNATREKNTLGNCSDCCDWERVRRFYPICITTGDTSKTNSTQALLRQGVVCLYATSFFSASVYLWL